MDPENDYSEQIEVTVTDAPQSNKNHSRTSNSTMQASSASLEHPRAEQIVKIADIQRMDIDQLNLYAKQIGLKHLGSLTKSQVVFEIVKAISENPNEVLYGEGVLEILPSVYN